MATPVSTLIVLDRERTLRFDYDALNFLSGLTVNELGGDRSPLDVWRLAGGMNTKCMALMLTAATKHEDKSVTVEGMRKALTHALRERTITFKKLNEALNAAINQSECIGLFQDDTGDDDNEAARPTTPPTTVTTPTAGMDASRDE
jgi:hypothetical protein